MTRKSDREAEKTYKRAIKRAMGAVNEARVAGALTEGDEMFLNCQLSINNNGNGKGGSGAMEQMMLRNEEAAFYNINQGLDGMTPQQIKDMKLDLLPEGTRQYDDGHVRGLPAGTERELGQGYEKVTIPAPIREKALLSSRIDLDDALGRDADERMAFKGTTSLNPMQSAVFDAAYGTRENLLICAPTGERFFCLFCVFLGLLLFAISVHLSQSTRVGARVGLFCVVKKHGDLIERLHATDARGVYNCRLCSRGDDTQHFERVCPFIVIMTFASTHRLHSPICIVSLIHRRG